MAAERRHTLYFLGETRAFSPVFLDSEIDMTAVLGHRAAERDAGRSLSVVSYVVHAVSHAMARHPEANAAVRGRLRPRLAKYADVNAKVTFDKNMNGHRVVLSAVLRGAQSATLDEIQAWLEVHRESDPMSAPEFAGVRLLHRLPAWLGRPAFQIRSRSLAQRPTLFGTVAVTSLGHRPVDGFHSVGGTTVTFGVGRIADRPVVREQQVTAVPVMRLSMAFDHRVIDGAEAADVLADVKAGLEGFAE
ncbi:2-oxo acid dehydrogenase subunit E2 [Actinoallomurus soli]|uniref:2-oxo acid dehydrogenase subunit E2 n=1 Tax=Actinoallomurus soli TaxID=2952535 RepID=UPI0020931DD0|nr:2-oxo acid dehydrogenase subunit E2 [Actinoallomurus soli]MCO5974059.1 2-oxo acid dehydrogenase subunit E2 [Actinoallomurus soli]